MARNISAHARYRLAATAFAVLGVVWCLGALIGHHGTMLLVVGMMHLAVSMLFMSLRPSKETARGFGLDGCDRRSRPGQSKVETRVKLATRRLEPAGETTKLTTSMGAARPRERKNRTWSI